MNIFRPYNASAEPQRDERGRLVGIDRYQDIMSRCWKRFMATGCMTMLGFLPFTLGCAYAILSSSILVLLPAAIVGGAVAGPFLACLYDTILRALRGAPGHWWANYKKAFAQNLRSSLLPGALTGLFLGAAAFTAMLFYWAQTPPGALIIIIYLFSWVLFLFITTLYWPQLVLFEQKNLLRLRNALLFALKYFWRTAGVVALQLVWWLLMVLFAPISLLLLPLVGCWLVLFIALFLLYDKLDKAFCIEENFAKQFPDQVERVDEV